VKTDFNNVPLLRRFGKTGLAFPEIGLGTWTFSGRDFGPMTEENCYSVIKTATDMGIRFFDTADVYGRGRVEKLLQKAFAEVPTDKVCNVFMASKIGNDFRYSEKSNKNFELDYLEEALTQSLARLQRPFLDLLQLHNPPTDILRNGRILELLQRWRDVGRIRLTGLSTTKVEDLKIITETDIVDAVQIPFNLLRQDLLLECEDLLVHWRGAVIIRTPLEFGLLSGVLPATNTLTEKDYRRNAWLPDEEKRKRAAVVELAHILTNNKRSLAQAAIQFTLLPKCVSVVIPGVRNIHQLTDNIAASRQVAPLTLKELRDVDNVLHNFGLASDLARTWGRETGERLYIRPKPDTTQQKEAGPKFNEPEISPLFLPLRLGSLTLKNRIIRSGTTERGGDEHGHPTTKITNIYRNLAAGGVSMIITGYIAIHPDAIASSSHCVLNESTLNTWRNVVDATHDVNPDVSLCAQLAHGGSLSHGQYQANDDTIIKQFIYAADLAWKAGFDAIQIHAAHGYLLSQLLAKQPLPHNSSTKNRGITFLKKLISKLKVSSDKKTMLVKLNMSDFLVGGYGPKDALSVASQLDEIKVDGIEWSAWIPKAAPFDSPSRPNEIDMRFEGFFVPFVSQVKKMFPSLPMGSCGGFRSTKSMVGAITEDKLDFVSLSRALIAEPDLPHRLAHGQKRAFCNGCNACLPRHIRPIYCPILSENSKGQ